MSVRLMAAVWDSGRYDGGTLLVLLALADWANDDGERIYPGLKKLAAKARLSERQAQRALRNLETDLVIVAEGEEKTGGRGRVTRYTLHVERVTKCPVQNEPAERVTSAAEKDDIRDIERATSEAERVTSAAAHIDNHQEPSKEPPSSTNARATAVQDEKQVKASKSVFDDRIWPEFKSCPGFSSNMAKASARAAFERIKEPVPSVAQLVGAIRGWAG